MPYILSARDITSLYPADIHTQQLESAALETAEHGTLPHNFFLAPQQYTHINKKLSPGATELYIAGVPKAGQERTGHRSVECLRMYERTSDKQLLAVSKILSSNTELNFKTEVKKLETHNTLLQQPQT